MAHVAKMSRAACGHMFKHYERARDEKGEYLKFGNQDIDGSRTPDNYNLAPEREISQGDFVRQRCEELNCLKRKDVNVMCSWVVTAPQSIAGTEHERQFFEESYKFLNKRYGADNVVSAYVHKDEITPHMHYAFVPVVADRRRDKLKVSAKECVNRADLQSFHKDLSQHMERVFGRDIGIQNEATKDGNRSIEELKRDTATQIMQDAREKARDVQAQAVQTVREVSERVEALRTEEKAIQGRLEGYKGAFKSIDEIEHIGKKTLTGGVTMSAQDAAKLKQQAAAYWSERSGREKAEREAVSYKRGSENTMQLRMENGKLKQDIREITADRDRIKKVVLSKPELTVAFKAQSAVLEAAARELQRDQRRGHSMDMSR